MSLLKQDTIRKRWVDEDAMELDTGDNKGGEYKMEAICNITVYMKKLVGYLPGLYYLVSWESYLEEENI